MQKNRKPTPPLVSTFRQYAMMFGGMAVAFGCYSFFSALDDLWGYRSWYGIILIATGTLAWLGAILWPRRKPISTRRTTSAYDPDYDE